MTCRLVALDKRTGVSPVGIGETLFRALAKILMRAAGDQANTACEKLQMCAGLKASIEISTHAVRKWILERVRARRSVEETGSVEEEEDMETVEVALNILSIETAVTEEEAAEVLKAALRIEVDGDEEGELEGE